DLILRGQYTEAQTALGPMYDRTLVQQQQYDARFKGKDAPGPPAIEAWYNEASRAAARGEGGGADEVAKKYAAPLGVLVAGAGVEWRIAEIAYFQNLCQQERAERLQYRLDHFPKEVSDQEIEEVKHLWEELEANWKSYLGLPSILVSARRFQARTEEK